ncbi:reticulon-4a isoform X1 [Austrofundulus limnaeus]|uniref:Reticulon n=1 Tax=Austrofundulus limnaeus TaxID=52670 RepID=A0A2I4CQV6_AUSLI|nr:PREDICTED: reticulon-4-like isoform X1 [Austrofundulus limnaeus]
MTDKEDLVSSTALFPEGHHYEPEPDPNLEPRQDHFSVDDIVDLVGGAQDALERHIQEATVTSTEPEESEVPDYTTPGFASVPEEESDVLAPKAEPESTRIFPESQPEPAPESDALPPAAAEPQKTAPSSAEADQQPPGAAPASYEPSSFKAQPCPLMQFPTDLGQKGDSPAPISPVSPLHSPDSLEELSLTESPNQPPPQGSSALLGSFSTEHPPKMLWESEDDHSKTEDDHLDLLAGPYLSLGKDSGPYNPCEDSGVSFSPEEKLISSDKSSAEPSSVNPHTKVPESHLASSNTTENWDSSFLSLQDNSKVSMDSLTKDKTTTISTSYEAVHENQSDEDEDLKYEVKKKNNPFEDYCPLADSGYSHFEELKSDTKASKLSESPTPDLVQYGQTGEYQENLSSILDEGKGFETSNMTNESLMQSLNQFSSGTKDEDEEEEEDSAVPTSLPDILKSFPLNPEKQDSGSSEGSPEEQSPILQRRMMESPNPPINLSANNPFAFDTKVSLLKEMTEEMEARASENVIVDEKSIDAFDLVKEAEETSPVKEKEEEPIEKEQKDWLSSQDSTKVTKTFEPLDFQSKKTTIENSDSESPTADSLSPVLEIMAKNPTSFQAETEKEDQKMDVEEPEMGEEVSEHDVSEEFEFIERPPRGIIDEFLEALDSSKFASSKSPEIPLVDDMSFDQKEPAPSAITPTKVTSHPESKNALSQSPYPTVTQGSPQKTKAELEKPDTQQPPTQASPTHPPVGEPEVIANMSVQSGKLLKMPNLSIRAVADLLYWRDVKTTGVVFGASLLLLLSLTVCSIVSVSSYIGLALLSVTICFRIYKGILQAIQKSDEGHPFKQYLDQEVALSEDTVHKYSDMVLERLNKTIGELRRLFLVEDLVDSIKFALLMWILTYVGAFFNGLTILILGLIGAFSCPIIYEKHQTQIDHYLALVNNQIKDVVGKVQAKVPGLKRKAE